LTLQFTGPATGGRSGARNKNLVLAARSAHCRRMAKTWVSKNDSKSQKAFFKAMRALIVPKGRRNHSRPR